MGQSPFRHTSAVAPIFPEMTNARIRSSEQGPISTCPRHTAACFPLGLSGKFQPSISRRTTEMEVIEAPPVNSLRPKKNDIGLPPSRHRSAGQFFGGGTCSMGPTVTCPN